jgi:hypothetical protein
MACLLLVFLGAISRRVYIVQTLVKFAPVYRTLEIFLSQLSKGVYLKPGTRYSYISRLICRIVIDGCVLWKRCKEDVIDATSSGFHMLRFYNLKEWTEEPDEEIFFTLQFALYALSPGRGNEASRHTTLLDHVTVEICPAFQCGKPLCIALWKTK